MFLGPHKMKMSHYFLIFDTLWNLGLFWFPTTTPLILNFSQLKLVWVIIMVYLAMFSTTIDNILFFGVLIRWKWLIFEDPPTPNFELFPTEIVVEIVVEPGSPTLRNKIGWQKLLDRLYAILWCRLIFWIMFV